MTNSFVHLEYSSSHPGVERFERVISAAGKLRRSMNPTRGLAAVLLAAMVATGQITGTWAIVASVIAAVFIATSLISFCPLYRLLGMNMCSRA